MKTIKAIFSKLILGIILIGLANCGNLSGNPDFEGEWVCKNDQKNTIAIKQIGKKTYELNWGTGGLLSDGKGVVFSGEVNEDGVLVVEMMGNISRFSIDKGELHFSGIVADCADYVRQ